MITKENVFAQAGKQDPERTAADFRTGMIPNTVAMAEDVNTYGNWSDKDLKVVCDELVNALQGQGITPNGSYTPDDATQLDTLLKTKMKSGFLLTGLEYDTYTGAPAQNGASVIFPSFVVVFNTDVYYGNTQDAMKRVSVGAQTVTANSTWKNGPHYLYATLQGTISHQETPVLGADSATKCYLGSLYVIDGSIQAGTWHFEPWLQISTPIIRESPTASRKGGYLTPTGGLELKMGTVQLLSEGINFGNNPLLPSIVEYQEKPFTYKYIYPGYNPSAADATAIDTTHLYNMTTGTLDDISSLAGKFICVVPCITPAGQTLLVPAMSYQTGTTYDSVFDSVDAARTAIFGLQYNLIDGSSNVNVASRCIYLGQTLILKVGATDLTNPENFANVGQVPQALASFSDASGQTGGGAGAYVPMISQTKTDSFTASTNNIFVVQGRTDHAVQIHLPNPTPNIVNQIEIHYRHVSGMQGLDFDENVSNAPTWWGSSPEWGFVPGNLYNIIFEWVVDKWMGGYLTTQA